MSKDSTTRKRIARDAEVAALRDGRKQRAVTIPSKKQYRRAQRRKGQWK